MDTAVDTADSARGDGSGPCLDAFRRHSGRVLLVICVPQALLYYLSVTSNGDSVVLVASNVVCNHHRHALFRALSISNVHARLASWRIWRFGHLSMTVFEKHALLHLDVESAESAPRIEAEVKRIDDRGVLALLRQIHAMA